MSSRNLRFFNTYRGAKKPNREFDNNEKHMSPGISFAGGLVPPRATPGSNLHSSSQPNRTRRFLSLVRSDSYSQASQVTSSTRHGRVESTNYACNYVFEDHKLRRVFIKGEVLELSAVATVKFLASTLKNKKAERTVELSDGRLLVFPDIHEKSEPEYIFPMHMIQAIEYPGQEANHFFLECWIPSPALDPEDKVLHYTNSVRLVMHFSNPTIAKKYLQFILLEVSRQADAIKGMLKAIADAKQVKSINSVSAPHIDCLMKKRIRMYRLALPTASMQQLEAEYDLGVYFRSHDKKQESETLFKRVDKQLKRKKKRAQQTLQQVFQAVTPLSHLDLLKIETHNILEQIKEGGSKF